MSSLIVPLVRISSIEKHPNADTLYIAKFENLGWQSIIKQGQFKVGDIAVFIPPDCILPDWLIEAEKITYLKNNAGRTSTVKLRGELSEGILIPVDAGDKRPAQYKALGDNETKIWRVGDNVSILFDITKYEPDSADYQKSGKKSKKRRASNGTFPRYTDIEHLKHFTTLLTENDEVDITEKIHGTNWRAGHAIKQTFSIWDKILSFFGKCNPWYFTCGSRNVEMGVNEKHSDFYGGFYKKNIYQEISRRLKNKIPEGYIVYGEIYGDHIQDLTYGLKSGKIDFVIFDVMWGGRYLNKPEMRAFLEANGLEDHEVPLLYTGKFSQEVVDHFTVGESELAFRNGVRQIKEGIVIKPVRERVDPVFGRVILKSINPDYLTRQRGTEYK